MENIQEQLLAQNQRLLQNLNTERHCKCEVNQLIGEITGQKISPSTEISLPFYTDFGRNIKIGENVSIGSGLVAADKGTIVIEDDVEIGMGVYLLSSDPTLSTDKIIIKKGAKIGSRSVIYPGVTIGKSVVVKPASVVKRSITGNEIFENK